MAVADATKCRRLGSNTGNSEDPEDGGAEDKCRDHRTASFRLRAVLRRRSFDVIGISLLAAAITISHGVMTSVLMQPPEALLVQIIRPIYWLTFVLFLLSWVGIVYHGPGRPPPVAPEFGESSRLPDTLAGALETGQFCRAPENKFGATDGFCDKCESWKPILTFHCKSCNQCSIWMDHHCYLTGQCIGFRNLRCFVVWLSYGEFAMIQIGLLTVHRLWLDGRPRDAWTWALWIGWFFYFQLVVQIIGGQLRNSIMRATAGWPSKILMLKFKGLLKDATALESEAQKLKEFVPQSLPEGVELREAHSDLRTAISMVQFRNPYFQGLLWGLFIGKDPRVTVATSVFGEPISWRWCVPLLPGGAGNPFRPTMHSTRSCDAWIGIASAMKRGLAAIAAATPLKQAAEDPDMFKAPCRMMMEDA